MSALLSCKFFLLFSKTYKHPILVLSDLPQNPRALFLSSLNYKNAFAKTTISDNLSFFIYSFIFFTSSLFITEPLYKYWP